MTTSSPDRRQPSSPDHTGGASTPDRGRGPGRPWQTSAPLLWIIIGLGLGARLVQYAANRSLWRDEAALALNLAGRSYAELLRPLDHHQTAPAGFLLLERLAVSTFGNTEAALRLFPLLAGCASLLLFWALARRCLPPAATLWAVLLAAISGRLIFYASEVKQYSSDVLVTIVILLAAFWIRSGRLTRGRVAAFGVAGGLAMWLSQPAAFVLAGAGTGLILLYARERRWDELRHLAPGFGLWALGAAPAIWLSLRGVDAASSAFLQDYWQRGFMPLPPRSREELLWPYHAMRALFADTAGVARPLLGILLAGIGCAWGLRHRRDTALLLLGPVLAALVASALRLYPFGSVAPGGTPFEASNGRVLLFLLPVLFLLIAAGIEYLRTRGELGRASAYVLLILLLYPPVRALATGFPRPREESRPLIEHLAAHRLPGDAIYVYSWTKYPFWYYAERFAIPPAAYTVGNFYREDPRELVREVEALRGARRVWILMSPVRSTDGVNHRDYLMRHLDATGTRLDEVARRNAFLYLYDLRDSSEVANRDLPLP